MQIGLFSFLLSLDSICLFYTSVTYTARREFAMHSRVSGDIIGQQLSI